MGPLHVRSIAASRKRSRDDSHAKAVAQLSEAFALVAEALKETASLGNVGANMRGALHDVEKLLPIIEAGAKSSDPERIIDRGLKWLQVASELGARKEGQITKKIQNLFMSREFNRQHGQDSNLKLLPHDPPTTKEIVVRSEASSKKTEDANDNWDEDDDNDDDDNLDNEPNPNDYEPMADHKNAPGRDRH